MRSNLLTAVEFGLYKGDMSANKGPPLTPEKRRWLSQGLGLRKRCWHMVEPRSLHFRHKHIPSAKPLQNTLEFLRGSRAAASSRDECRYSL